MASVRLQTPLAVEPADPASCGSWRRPLGVYGAAQPSSCGRDRGATRRKAEEAADPDGRSSVDRRCLRCRIRRARDTFGATGRFTLRNARLWDLEGRLHINPDREVCISSGLTGDSWRAVVDVGIGHDEDLDRAFHISERFAEGFARDSGFGPCSTCDGEDATRHPVGRQPRAPGKHFLRPRPRDNRAAPPAPAGGLA
jgi:hypothetical protein